MSKGPYDDIIGLPHPVSRRHRPMSLLDRAAQFAPFAALKGYDKVLDRNREEEISRYDEP